MYYWGKGVAIDYERAMAAYKISAEAGEAVSQYQVGTMYYTGQGVAVDYEQARPWIEKAAAQDHPQAVSGLGMIYGSGKGVAPSWRRARELFERAIESPGNSVAVKNMQILTEDIQTVSYTSRIFHHLPLRASRHSCPFPPFLDRTHRSPPSWTSGWRSTARAAPT